MNEKLSYVLKAKIVVSIAVWCIPALFFPVSLLVKLGFPAPDPIIYTRLLGMAYLALVVGYCFGITAIRRGEYPAAPVCVGIVSNGGAALILAMYGLSGHWQNWGAVAQVVMWGSLIATSVIAAGLFVYGALENRCNLLGKTRASLNKSSKLA